ncbi:hypothetical protein FB45DRAFT_1062375 [Roridomyces roridus]|uniref:Uncharacterized protein n=1 Tax=Roridomyces roridus TaxID=1738132 RepID=A0AAD7BHP9_9AGAR|nr:hypothetical protein FB45DRAFT_1062375 [Roridomyces roridus]
MSLDKAVLVNNDLFCLTRLKTLPFVDAQDHTDFLNSFRRRSRGDARIKVVQYKEADGFARGTWVPMVYLEECLTAMGVTDESRKEIYEHIKTNCAVVLPPQESYSSFKPVLAPAFTETEMPISPKPKRSPNKRPRLSSSLRPMSTLASAIASPPSPQNFGSAIPEFASISSMTPEVGTPPPSFSFEAPIPAKFEFEPSTGPSFTGFDTGPSLTTPVPTTPPNPNPTFSATLQGVVHELTDLRHEMEDRHALEREALAQDVRERQADQAALMQFHAQLHEVEARGGPVEVLLSRLGALEDEIVRLHATQEDLAERVEQLEKDVRGMVGMEEVRAMQMDALLERIQALEAGVVAF